MIVGEIGSGFDGKTSLRGWIIWGTAALFYLYEFFVRVAPSAMEPELQAHFGLSAAALGAAAGTYYLIYSPMQLVSGTMIDRFGPKKVLVLSALVCTAGAFLEVLGTSSAFLVAARFCQGAGSAFAFVGTMYIAAEWFPRSMLALLSGLTTSLGMAGAIIGNSGIARLVETVGWQVALLAAGFVGLGVTALILVIVPSKGRPPAAAEAIVPKPHVLKALKIVYSNPQSWLIGIVGASLYMPLSILGALWGEEYVSAVTGGDKVEAAGAISMMYVGWLIGGPIAGFVSDRYHIRRKMLMGASVATLLVTFAIAVIPSMSVEAAYGMMLLLGFASTSQVVCFASAVEHNPHGVTGTALAATNMMIMLLGGIGEWAFGVALDFFDPAVNGVVEGAHYSIAAYHSAVLILPIICAFGLLAAMLLSEVGRAAQVSVGAGDVVAGG